MSVLILLIYFFRFETENCKYDIKYFEWVAGGMISWNCRFLAVSQVSEVTMVHIIYL